MGIGMGTFRTLTLPGTAFERFLPGRQVHHYITCDETLQARRSDEAGCMVQIRAISDENSLVGIALCVSRILINTQTLREVLSKGLSQDGRFITI